MTDLQTKLCPVSGGGFVHWSKHIVTEGTFSITKEANPTNNIWGTRVNEGTFRQVRGAKYGCIFGGIYSKHVQAKHFFSW